MANSGGRPIVPAHDKRCALATVWGIAARRPENVQHPPRSCRQRGSSERFAHPPMPSGPSGGVIGRASLLPKIRDVSLRRKRRPASTVGDRRVQPHIILSTTAEVGAKVGRLQGGTGSAPQRRHDSRSDGVPRPGRLEPAPRRRRCCVRRPSMLHARAPARTPRRRRRRRGRMRDRGDASAGRRRCQHRHGGKPARCTGRSDRSTRHDGRCLLFQGAAGLRDRAPQRRLGGHV